MDGRSNILCNGCKFDIFNYFFFIFYFFYFRKTFMLEAMELDVISSPQK